MRSDPVVIFDGVESIRTGLVSHDEDCKIQAAYELDAFAQLPTSSLMLHPDHGVTIVDFALQLHSATALGVKLEHSDVSKPQNAPVTTALAVEPSVTSQHRHNELVELLHRLGLRNSDILGAEASLLTQTWHGMHSGRPSSAAETPVCLLDTFLQSMNIGSVMEEESVSNLLQQLQVDSLTLSKQGWTSLLLLDITKLHTVLECVLKIPVAAAAAAGSSEDTLAAVIDIQQSLVNSAQSELLIALEAIAEDSKLHIAARSVLHSWLQTSGNVVIWKLLLHLIDIVVAHKDETHASLVQQLYPKQMQILAQLVHTLPCTAPADLIVLRDNIKKHVEASTVDDDLDNLQLDVWRLLLDNKQWAVLAMQILGYIYSSSPLPTEQTQTAAGAHAFDGSGSDDDDGGFGNLYIALDETLKATRSYTADEKEAAADYLGWLLWPHDEKQKAQCRVKLLGSTEKNKLQGEDQKRQEVIAKTVNLWSKHLT